MQVLRTLSAMAWRNLWRHGRRSALTASAIAVAAAMCMASIALNDGVYVEIFRVLVEQQVGHVIVRHPDYPTRRQLYDTIEPASPTLAAIDAVEGVAVAAPRLVGFALVGGPSDAAGARLVGVLPNREARFSGVEARLVSGTYLPRRPEQRILLGQGLAEELAVDVGDEVVVVTQAADGSLGNALYIVQGIFRIGDAAMDRSGAFLHLQDLQELLVLPDQAHEITLLASDSDAIAEVAAQVDAVLEAPRVQTWWEAAPQTKQMLDMSSASKLIVLGIVFTVAAFGVINTMTMSVFERTRELGVLRAIGLRPGRLVALVVLESLQLSLLGAFGGLVLGGALDAWLVFYGLDFSGSMEEGFSFAGVTIDPVMKGHVRADGVLLTLGAILVVGVVASLWPAARAARLRPVDAIRTE